MKNLLVVLFLLVVSGCANQRLSPEDARGIPESRMLQKNLLERHAGKVEVTFIREDATVSGVASSANLFLNDEPLAALWAGEKFTAWVDPRLYVVSLSGSERWVKNSVAFASVVSNAAPWRVEVDARVGRRYEVRVDFTNWTGIRLQARSVEVEK
jgi:hypothetical protein